MKLQVEQAKEQIGRVVPFLCTTSGDDLGDVSAFPWSRHDITISGELRYDGQHYVVNGTITTNGQYECSRCLTDTNYTHTVPFEETFGVSHSTYGDDDVIFFDGEEIDLTETIRESSMSPLKCYVRMIAKDCVFIAEQIKMFHHALVNPLW